MPNRLPFYRSIIFALVAALCLFSWVTSAAGDGDDKTEASRDGAGQAVGFSARQLDRLAIDDEALNELLEECPIVKQINEHKTSQAQPPSGLTERLFGILFPAGPAGNALLATLYISGPPNLFLGLCPPDIDPSSLNVMTAFAVGGLLGDTLFHLLPEIFVGEADEGGKLKFVVVDPNKNLLLGVAIMVGFVTFLVLDKGARIFIDEGEEGGAHSHGHAHGGAHVHGTSATDEKGTSTAIDSGSSTDLRSRTKTANTPGASTDKDLTTTPTKSGNKHASYLALIADFTHNITDGLALGSAFYASPTLGATTTMAVFFHEIPHEVGDFALLVRAGFSKRAAMSAQFVTALGALTGTVLSIAINELAAGGSGNEAGVLGDGAVGILGTTLGWGDMLLPFTAGTFLYVGTVGVIPDILQTGTDKAAEVKTMIKQLVAMAVGAGIMLAISWS